MSHTGTEEGFATSSRDSRAAIARSEAAAAVHVQRDRSVLYKGLCTNCEKLQTCSYPSAINETWYCEEYSVQGAPKLITLQPQKEEQLPETIAGLCMNCELRTTCQLPKPAGGVWFCNEYE